MFNGKPALHFGLRGNNIRQPLDLDQIKLAIMKRTSTEFARISRAQAG